MQIRKIVERASAIMLQPETAESKAMAISNAWIVPLKGFLGILLASPRAVIHLCIWPSFNFDLLGQSQCFVENSLKFSNL